MHASVSGCLAAVSYHAYGMTPAQIRAAAHDIDVRCGVPAIVTEDGAASMNTDGESRRRSACARCSTHVANSIRR